MDDFVCVVVNGNTFLNDTIRDELLTVAYVLLRAREKRKRLKCEGCEGRVSTTLETMQLSSISGTGFTAELDTDKGKCKVTYIVRGDRLSEMEQVEFGAWLSADDFGKEIDKDRLRPNPLRRLVGTN